MIEAAAKYNRIVQNGTQARANTARQQAVKLLREGVIGDIHLARAIYFAPQKRSESNPTRPCPRA